MSRQLFGRRVLYSDYEVVDRSNVLAVLTDAKMIHEMNRNEIEYLYNYYKGKQPILERVKNIRPEINNTIVENRANEIVSFKVGYLMGEPVQYVSRADGNTDGNNSETTSKYVSKLNEYVFAEDKACKDKELADWFSICGTAYRMVLPKNSSLNATADVDDESPFSIYTLDPRDTFIVYSNALGNPPICAVKYITRTNNDIVYSIYTPTHYYEVLNGVEVTQEIPHSLGAIPIIEYPHNDARIGCFELVVPLLDALNKIESNRVDGLEQFVQSLLVLKGADMDDEDFKAMREQGGIKVPVDGDVTYLVQELNQTQTQTLVDYLYQTILTICGMPSQANGQISDSSNNGAVILRNGWQSAEARAKDTELVFKRSEKQFLKLAIKICNVISQTDLKLSQIEIRFTRRNYENIQMKAQVLTQMLASDEISPKLAFEYCGMFADPELAYNESKAYAEQKKAEEKAELEQYALQTSEEEKTQINEEVTNEDE